MTAEDREEEGLSGEELLGAVGGAPVAVNEEPSTSSESRAPPAETVTSASVFDSPTPVEAPCPWEGTLIFDLEDPLDQAIVTSTPSLVSSYQADLALLDNPNPTGQTSITTFGTAG